MPAVFTRATFLFVSSAAWCGCEHADATEAPPPDARPSPRGYGSIDIDTDGTQIGASLHGELRKEETIRSGQAPEQIGWLLRGTDAAGCDETSITCVSLQIRLPLVSGIGPHTCGEPDTELELLVNLGTPYYHYVSSTGDACAFELTDDGHTWVAMQHLDLTMQQDARTVHVTGDLAAEVW